MIRTLQHPGDIALGHRRAHADAHAGVHQRGIQAGRHLQPSERFGPSRTINALPAFDHLHITTKGLRTQLQQPVVDLFAIKGRGIVTLIVRITNDQHLLRHKRVLKATPPVGAGAGCDL